LYRQAPEIAPTPQVAAQKQIQQQQQQQQQEKQVPLPGAASIGISKQAQ
jgi:vacuolar protein sorting-associated protein 26